MIGYFTMTRKEQIEEEIMYHERQIQLLHQGCTFIGEHPAAVHRRELNKLQIELQLLS